MSHIRQAKSNDGYVVHVQLPIIVFHSWYNSFPLMTLSLFNHHPSHSLCKPPSPSSPLRFFSLSSFIPVLLVVGGSRWLWQLEGGDGGPFPLPFFFLLCYFYFIFFSLSFVFHFLLVVMALFTGSCIISVYSVQLSLMEKDGGDMEIREHGQKRNFSIRTMISILTLIFVVSVHSWTWQDLWRFFLL